MARHPLFTLSLAVIALLGCWATVFSSAPKKILYVDSYHEAYPWSAGISQGIRLILAEKKDIELKILRMDSKRNPAEAFNQAAALKNKNFIDGWQPDLIITSDDNAAKYLIVPYFKGKSIPVVFCGVNWDATDYGFPAANVTGMIEVQLIGQIIDSLQKYAAGTRIAFLKGDDLSARKEAVFFEKRYDLKLDKRFVTNFSAWKDQYLQLQKDADLILLGNSISIPDWDKQEAQAFVLANTLVPSGNWDEWMAPFSLITFANSPEEQGEWAATAALKILAGTSPQAIPLTTNQRGKLYLNMELAKKLGIKFPIELIERATFTSEIEPR
jgi:ABC-type uncharacterized transport system substrate-binding protein